MYFWTFSIDEFMTTFLVLHNGELTLPQLIIFRALMEQTPKHDSPMNKAIFICNIFPVNNERKNTLNTHTVCMLISNWLLKPAETIHLFEKFTQFISEAAKYITKSVITFSFIVQIFGYFSAKLLFITFPTSY